MLGPLLFLLYTSDLPIALENMLVGYADDSTLLAEVPEPGSRVQTALSLNRDLARIGDWCKRWGMLVNPLKTKALVISRSRTLMPIFPNLVLDGTVVERVTELKVLGVVLDAKLSFEGHIRSIAASASSKLGIMRKALCLVGDPVLVLRYLWSFLLPVLEYCSPVLMSAADSHFGLLDRVVSKAVSLKSGCMQFEAQTSCRCTLHGLKDLL